MTSSAVTVFPPAGRGPVADGPGAICPSVRGCICAFSGKGRIADPAPTRTRRSGYQLTGRALPSSYPAADCRPTRARSRNSATVEAPA